MPRVRPTQDFLLFVSSVMGRGTLSEELPYSTDALPFPHRWGVSDVVTTISSGPWDEVHIRDFLRSTVIPLRLASNGSSGPLVQSLWFWPDGTELWCCTQDSSVLARRLSRDDRVGFEVAADTPPYRGVRGTGVAELLKDNVETALRHLITRYQGHEKTQLSEWLLSRIESEVAIRITPRTLSSWDYSPRMKK